jgi:LmbE family N-acetylglucosaminyl deacetylase
VWRDAREGLCGRQGFMERARLKKNLRLLAVLAHPDDESLGFGGTLAKYAAEGIETFVVTATRGEAGRFGSIGKGHDPEEVGRVREAELRGAAEVLGVREVTVLGFPDSAVDQVPYATAIGAMVAQIRRIRPDVVVTFGPEGAYGHPDHIAVSQFATAAVLCAADAEFRVHDTAPHRVAKFYYLAWRGDKWAAYQAAFRKLTSTVDGVERQAIPWADWAVTTAIDTTKVWRTVWDAVCRHQTQISIYDKLGELTTDQQMVLWGSQEFYRVFSTVNGGREVERDLFEGLRRGLRARN